MNNLETKRRSTQSLVTADRVYAGPTGIPQMPAPSEEQTSVNFGEIVNTIREGKWIILLTCVLLSAGVVGYKLTETRMYESSSLVSINTGNKSSSPLDRISPITTDRSQADELSFLVNSGELNRRVAQRLKDAATGLGTDTLFSALQSPGLPPTLEEIALRIRTMVQFMPAEQSMITMKAVSPSRHEAMRLANIYAEEYRMMEQERSRARLANARDFLRARLDERRNELTQLDFEWEASVSSGDAMLEGSQGEILIQQYGQLQAKLESQELQLETEKRQFAHLQGEYERVGQNLVEQVGSGAEKEIEALQSRIAELKIKAEEFYIHDPTRRGREAEIPELNDLVMSIEHLEEQKNTLAERLVTETLAVGAGSTSGSIEPLSYATQIRAKIVEKELLINELEFNVNALNSRVNDIRLKLEQIPSRTLQQQDIERRRAVVEQWYRTLQQELQKTEIALESEIGNVSIVRQARGADPVGNDLSQSLILGLIIGLSLGTGIAFMRKAVDRRVYKPSDIKDLGFNLVGVIPEMHQEIKASFGGNELIEYNGASWNTHLISILQPSSSISENYRLTRTNIDFLYEESPPQVVLITSPESGDGKSVTSVNLAATMAESGRRTLLLDLDLRKPSLHNLLGVDRAPGLLDLLMNPGEFLLEEFATNIRDLHFIPAGSSSTRPSELVGSSILRDGLHSLREIFDSIIIDSPPVLAVTDAVVIATLCDATILVCNATSTDKQALDVTSQTLEAVGINVAGVILNKFDSKKAGMRGYSIYGYDGTYGYTSEYSAA